MSCATGRTLKSFQTMDPDAAEVKPNGELDLPHPASAAFGVPPLLTLVSDQQSVQLCSLAYCEYALRLNLVHWPDPFHMAWKDICEACAKSGFQAIVQASLVVFNVAYGPFHRAAFYNDLRGAASDVSVCMSPNDALLIQLWPAIMCDVDVAESDIGGEDQRAQWLRELPLQKPGDLKGPNAPTSRWFSFLHSQRHWDQSWHCKLLLLVWVALRKGWAAKEEDIFRHDTAAARQRVQEAMSALGSGAAAAASSSGSASSSAGSSSAASSNGRSAAPGVGPPSSGGGASSASNPASCAGGEQLDRRRRSRGERLVEQGRRGRRRKTGRRCHEGGLGGHPPCGCPHVGKRGHVESHSLGRSRDQSVWKAAWRHGSRDACAGVELSIPFGMGVLVLFGRSRYSCLGSRPRLC